MVFINFCKNKIKFFFCSVLETLVVKEEQNAEGTFNEGNLFYELSIFVNIYLKISRK
jgi:hypothetical protein